MKLASTRTWLLTALLGATLFSQPARADSAAQKVAAIREVPFQMLASGARSEAPRAAKMIVGNEKEWARVWRVHDQNAPLPKIDFSRYRVIALLSGKGNPALDLVQVASTRDEVTVFFRRAENAKSGDAPFRFARIEKTGSRARFLNENGKECAICHIAP